MYTESPLGFIEKGNQEIWVGFFGAVIGGLLTLFGVIITIRHEKNLRNIDKRLDFMPILKVSKSKMCDTENTLSNEVPSFKFMISINEPINLDKEYMHYKLFPQYLNFKNIGKGLAKDIQVDSFELFQDDENTDNSDFVFYVSCKEIKNNMKQFLVNDEIFTIPLTLNVNNIPDIQLDFDEYIHSNRQTLKFYLKYNDINNNTYKQSFLVHFGLIMKSIDIMGYYQIEIEVDYMFCETHEPIFIK